MKSRTCQILTCLSFLLFLTFLAQASPQDITVRVIDARSGKPLSKIPTTMFSWKGAAPRFDPRKPFPKGEEIRAITDAEGRVVFHLPEPVPDYIGFLLEPPTDFSGCWHRSTFIPETVLRSGIVAEYDESKCGKLRKQIWAKPGEVIIFEKKLTWWEHVRRELP